MNNSNKSVQADGSNVSKLSAKHSENYVGTFSKNVHVAQCFNCHSYNRQLLASKNYLAECMKEKNMKVADLPTWNLRTYNEALSQEWYQRKNMIHYSAESGETFDDKDMFFCKECDESLKLAEVCDNPY